jgi:hypothetical protein
MSQSKQTGSVPNHIKQKAERQKQKRQKQELESLTVSL